MKTELDSGDADEDLVGWCHRWHEQFWLCALLWHLIMQVEAKLARRLEAGLKAWTQALVSEGTSKEEADFSMDTDAPAVAVHRLGGDPKLKVIFLYTSVDCCCLHTSCMYSGCYIHNYTSVVKTVSSLWLPSIVSVLMMFWTWVWHLLERPFLGLLLMYCRFVCISMYLSYYCFYADFGCMRLMIELKEFVNM